MITMTMMMSDDDNENGPQVVKEAMRYYTVSPLVARETSHEIQIGGCIIPKVRIYWWMNEGHQNGLTSCESLSRDHGYGLLWAFWRRIRGTSLGLTSSDRTGSNLVATRRGGAIRMLIFPSELGPECASATDLR